MLRKSWASKNIGFCALIFTLLSSFFSACAYGANGKEILSVDERAWLTENQSRLTLAVETGYAPFVFIDSNGRPMGLAHDYLRLIESKLGVQFKQKRYASLDAIFQAVRTGEVHIVNAVTSTPSRAKFLSITDSFISVPNVMVVRKDYPDQISDKKLSGLRVSLVKSYAVTEHMTSHDLRLIPDIVPDDLTALLNVSFGRSDAAVIDLATASYLITQKGIVNLRVAGEVGYDIKLSLATPLNEPALFGILQKGLGAITDAERQEIKNRWINASGNQGIFSGLSVLNFLEGVMVVALLIFAIIFVRNRTYRLQATLSLVVLVSGLIATYFLQQDALTAARKIQQEEFNFQAREIVQSIQQRMTAYEQVLQSTCGLFSASHRVERNEFHDFIASLRLGEVYPGIQGVGFSQLIPPQEKGQHIETIRKEGFPDYTVRPDGERSLYTSIIYLEPFTDRNLRAFGFDMYSEVVRRRAMEQARDSNASAMSGKVRLVQENDQNVQAGFLMYAPVYRNDRPHSTLEERRANILGWAYAPFRMDDLMRGILGSQVNNFDLEIYDGNNATPEALMYDSAADSAMRAVSPLYSFSQDIRLIGHDWSVRLTTLPGFEAKIDTGRVTAIRLAGILMSALLSLLVWQLATGRARALALAQEMTRALSERELQLAEAQSLAKLGSWRVVFGVDEAHDTWTISKELRKIYGHADGKEINASTGYELMPKEDQELTRRFWEAAKQGVGPREWDHRIIVNGETKWIHVLANFVYDAEGKPLRASGTNQDITERKQAEAALQESEFRWKFALEGSGDGVWDWDIPNGTVYFSKRWKEMLGFTEEEIGNGLEEWESRIHPDDKAETMSIVQAYLDGKAPVYVSEHRVKCKDGGWKWILDRGMVVSRSEDGKPLRMIGTHTDITERKQNEQLVQRMAHYDILTGLPNRALFSDRLQQAFAISRRDGSHLALMFIDLDKFKPINDELGHYVGDLLLKEVAKRMHDCMRESDTVARVGGDEFVVLLPEIESVPDALLVAEKIREVLDQPFLLAGQSLSISSSIGVAVYPEHGKDEAQLLKRADAAMYWAKEEGRNRVMMYQPDSHDGGDENISSGHANI